MKIIGSVKEDLSVEKRVSISPEIVKKYKDLGLSINHLFGSSRDEQSMVVNSTYYRLFNIRTYNGSTINVDFAGQMFTSAKYSILFFAKIEMTNKPVSGTLYKFDLFEDVNNNYTFDSQDYPSEVQVDTLDINDIHAPNSMAIGVNLSTINSINSVSYTHLTLPTKA